MIQPTMAKSAAAKKHMPDGQAWQRTVHRRQQETRTQHTTKWPWFVMDSGLKKARRLAIVGGSSISEDLVCKLHT